VTPARGLWGVKPRPLNPILGGVAQCCLKGRDVARDLYRRPPMAPANGC
jgi:hypothetical protein